MSSPAMMRVASRRIAPFRRAGFVFGPEPLELTREELTPEKVDAILAEPMLVSEISHDGETWFAPEADFRSGFATLAAATRGMTRDAIRVALIDGALPIDDLVRRAMLAEGAISAAEPGKGAGADHPGASFMSVPQPEVDPNPALPAAGGSSDAGVAVTVPADVQIAQADVPVAPEVLAANLATPAPVVPAVPAAETVPVLAQQPANAEVPGDVVTDAVPVVPAAPVETVIPAAPIAVATTPVTPAVPVTEPVVPVATTPHRRSHKK